MSNQRRFQYCFVPLLFGFFILGASGVSAEQWPVKNPAQVCSPIYLKESVSVEGFQFRSYRNEESGEACLQIIQAGKALFQRTNDNDGYFDLGQKASGDGTVRAIANGTDITGRGHPDMIVSQWTGGAHCCRLDYVFELSPKFKLLATLDARDSDGAHFADLDDNGRYYYLAADWTFAYWWESFAGSPVHPIVLRFIDDNRGGGYHLALEKMARPAPSAAEWADALSRVSHELQLNETNMANDLPNVLWQEVLDLIYSGHADLAWKFLREVGPKAQQGNYPDLGVFCSTLKTSPYWLDLRETMQDAPTSCMKALPKK